MHNTLTHKHTHYKEGNMQRGPFALSCPGLSLSPDFPLAILCYCIYAYTFVFKKKIYFSQPAQDTTTVCNKTLQILVLTERFPLTDIDPLKERGANVLCSRNYANSCWSLKDQDCRPPKCDKWRGKIVYSVYWISWVSPSVWKRMQGHYLHIERVSGLRFFFLACMTGWSRTR